MPGLLQQYSLLNQKKRPSDHPTVVDVTPNSSVSHKSRKMSPGPSRNLQGLVHADLSQCSMGGSGDQSRESVQKDFISPQGSRILSSTNTLLTDHSPSLDLDIFNEDMTSVGARFPILISQTRSRA